MPELAINLDATVDFLVGLLNTPSPTGYYVEAIEYVRQAFAALPNLELSTTNKGALVATARGIGSDAPRGVTAHVDTLGLMVKDIKPSGRLKLTSLGGFMWNAVEWEGVTIRTHDDRRYRGTVLPSNPSTHVNNKLGSIERTADLMEVRIDALTTSAAETRALGIEVGDFIFLDPRVELTDTGFIRSRHLDDKAGVAAIYGALLALGEAGLSPAQDTTVLIANYEEVGHGGSAGLPMSLAELLTVDMAALGEGQNSDEFHVTICVKDSTGPYHFEMNNKLRRIAAEHHIPYKTDIYPYYGSDGSAYWRAGGDARFGLIGPGVEASHAYERTHRDSLLHSAHLIVRYLLDDAE
ncbi:MAG: M42 family metallopeptidase [Anaerolineae bacterium]|nr:M42 family metallopeptidase [Anaerolineae bacterium]